MSVIEMLFRDFFPVTFRSCRTNFLLDLPKSDSTTLVPDEDLAGVRLTNFHGHLGIKTDIIIDGSQDHRAAGDINTVI
jgi:hypothetical protein